MTSRDDKQENSCNKATLYPQNSRNKGTLRELREVERQGRRQLREVERQGCWTPRQPREQSGPRNLPMVHRPPAKGSGSKLD